MWETSKKKKTRQIPPVKDLLPSPKKLAYVAFFPTLILFPSRSEGGSPVDDDWSETMPSSADSWRLFDSWSRASASVRLSLLCVLREEPREEIPLLLEGEAEPSTTWNRIMIMKGSLRVNVWAWFSHHHDVGGNGHGASVCSGR